jgi:Fe-S cluster biogenesis protein NfuA
MSQKPASKPAPAAPPGAPSDEERIKAMLDEVRPYLNRDGGDVEFVAYENRIVKIKLHGACGTCPSSLMTLRMGIENALREVVPDVQEVRNVDEPAPGAHDHGHAHGHGHGAIG